MDEDNENIPESQGKQGKKGYAGADRKRYYAFLVYPDSAYPDWMERLTDRHVEALVSPLHDADVNPDGTPKKPHWHVLILCPGKKSRAQIDELRREVIGENFNKAFENVDSPRGYARYLCHLDNPEKAQYSKADVVALGGVDYEAMIMTSANDTRMLADMFRFIEANGIEYFADFMLVCEKSNPEWFDMLTRRKCYVVVEFIKSFSVKKARERDASAGMRGYFNNVEAQGAK